MKYSNLTEGTESKKGEKNNKKIRLLELLRFLYQDTDEAHGVTTNEIIEHFKKMGLSVNRKTVKDDMELLLAADYDIVITRTAHNNRFYMASREFELPELKMLIDAVAASKIISVQKTQELIDKLKKQASKYQAEELEWNSLVNTISKPESKNIYLSVDKITKAIAQKKKLVFQYKDYDSNKTEYLKHNGFYYMFSPYMLMWSDDHYYVVGYSDKHQNIANFRVDRLHCPNISEERAVRKPSNFDEEKYAKRSFEMMGNPNREKTVVMKCKNELMRVVIDRFGMDVSTVPMRGANKGYFKVTAKVYPSPNFYSWIFRFKGDIKIINPPTMREEYADMLKKGLE